MIVVEDDLEKPTKLKYKYCNLCDKPFEVGQLYEKVTSHSKTKMILHLDCIKKGI